jgi:MFS family permease
MAALHCRAPNRTLGVVSQVRLVDQPSEPRSPDDRYKWVALSNTTLGSLMAMIDITIMLIALPDIFRGIHIDPLLPKNSFYLLWMILSFMVVTSVLVVSLGRLGDMYGRVRIYNLGFAVYTFFSLLLAITWMSGTAAALWLVIMRVFQGVGAAMLIANSSAILTDAFPENQRGMALGINQVAGLSGSFIGLILGGVLAPIQWRLIFLVSVPIGLFGTVWAYRKLREVPRRLKARLDWPGNLTFAFGLIGIMVGITYGIQPYGGSTMGWTSPFVLGCLAGGIALLVAFAFIEQRVADPMFRLPLFRIRAFTAGSLSSLLASMGRGGLMFILIPARLRLQPHAAVGRHLHAADDRWFPDRRADLGILVGPIRIAPVRHGRNDRRRRLVPASRAPAHQLHLRRFRADPPAERPGHGGLRVT